MDGRVLKELVPLGIGGGVVTADPVVIPTPSTFSGSNNSKLLGGKGDLAESIIGKGGIDLLRQYCQGTESRLHGVYFGLKERLGEEPLLWKNLTEEEKEDLALAVQQDTYEKRWDGRYIKFFKVFQYPGDWFFKQLAYDVCRNNARRLKRPTSVLGAAKAVKLSTDQIALEMDKTVKASQAALGKKKAAKLAVTYHEVEGANTVALAAKKADMEADDEEVEKILKEAVEKLGNTLRDFQRLRGLREERRKLRENQGMERRGKETEGDQVREKRKMGMENKEMEMVENKETEEKERENLRHLRHHWL